MKKQFLKPFNYLMKNKKHLTIILLGLFIISCSKNELELTQQNELKLKEQIKNKNLAYNTNSDQTPIWMDVRIRIYAILAENLNVEEYRLTMETDLVNDLGADELAIREIIEDIENEFEIDIFDEEAEKLITVNNYLEFVSSRLKGVTFIGAGGGSSIRPYVYTHPGAGGGNGIPSGGAYIIGGGSGSNSTSISSTAMAEAKVVDDGKPKIQDIKKYLDCFTDGKQAKSYTMTIYADQPVPGQNDSYKIVVPTGGINTNIYGVPTGVVFQTVGGQNFDVGHTFVTFEKNNMDGTNVRQTLGFYPSSNPISSKGAIKDNSGHNADVKYTMNVTQEQFEAALRRVENDFNNKDYNLTNMASNEYNCTSAAISWMNAAGANFSNSSSGLFKNTPGSFGQVLRSKQGAYVNPTSGINGKGPCN
ncbi:Acyl carrier protein [compost metagenome]